ncbi:hypothetical protein OIO90_006180 [Microbotryomycetes sp. JL221]|nr:hypothetical protein OIO90_006180 [Microbotryomycetes sp. JL221]
MSAADHDEHHDSFWHKHNGIMNNHGTLTNGQLSPQDEFPPSKRHQPSSPPPPLLSSTRLDGRHNESNQAYSSPPQSPTRVSTTGSNGDMSSLDRSQAHRAARADVQPHHVKAEPFGQTATKDDPHGFYNQHGHHQDVASSIHHQQQQQHHQQPAHQPWTQDYHSQRANATSPSSTAAAASSSSYTSYNAYGGSHHLDHHNFTQHPPPHPWSTAAWNGHHNHHLQHQPPPLPHHYHHDVFEHQQQQQQAHFMSHQPLNHNMARSTEPWSSTVTATSTTHSPGVFATSALFSHSPTPTFPPPGLPTTSANGTTRPGSGDSDYNYGSHTSGSASGLPPPSRAFSNDFSHFGGSVGGHALLPLPTNVRAEHQRSTSGQSNHGPSPGPHRASSLPGHSDHLAAYASISAAGATHLGSHHSHGYPYPSLPPQPIHSFVGNGAVTWSNSSGSASPTTPASTMTTNGCCPPGSATSVALAASANRARIAHEKASKRSPNSSNNDSTKDNSTIKKQTSQPVKKPVSRPSLELTFDCRFCNKSLAKLTLRGAGTFTSGRHEGVYYCLNCVPLPIAPKATLLNSLEEEASYSDTLSATVDRLEGLSVEERDTRPPPANRSTANGGISSKKRTKMDDDVLTCDVCRRDVGTGGLRLVGANEGESTDVTIEVLCAHCESRYLRCSDCGGGGGNRGVGRWRAKEMFPEGRRTCQLSHVRIGTLNEMTYDVWPITTIPRAQLPKLIDMCRELYTTTLYATLAVPDMMESQGALARSFEEVEKQAMDSWTYVALRWSTPTTRKSKKAKNVTTTTNQEDESSDDPTQPVPLIRQGKVLAGFILAEWDLNIGSLHVALTMPTGSGESYDAASRLMSTLFKHVKNDVASVNYARKQQGATPLPGLKQAWSLHMIKRDSRIMSRIESRRGFVPLDDYLTKYPDANRSDFAPIRPVFLPPELLRGWFVFVKRIEEGDDEADWLKVANPKFSQSGY